MSLVSDEWRTIMIMGSQKTLPMSIAVITFITPALGEAGLMAVPCIVSHLSQLLIDSAIVSAWLHRDAQKSEELNMNREEGEEHCKLPPVFLIATREGDTDV